jgi:uncharacterized protein YcbX
VTGLVVTRLSTTPIKGLRMHEPAEIELGRAGAAGDRSFLLVGAEGRVRSVTQVGALLRMRADFDPACEQLTVACDDGRSCDGVVELGAPVAANALDVRLVAGHEVVGPWSEFISGVAGEPLRLVKVDEPGTANDLAAVTLLGEGSLEDLGRRSGLGALDPRRFRMLIQFGPSEPYLEDTWEGREIDVGLARLRVGATVPRCAATTRDPERGVRDAPVVRAIKDYRGIQPTGWGDGVPFGVYADVVRPGRVRVGDAVQQSADA